MSVMRCQKVNFDLLNSEIAFESGFFYRPLEREQLYVNSAGSNRIVIPVVRKLTLQNWVVESVVPDSFFYILLLHSLLYFSLFRIIAIKIFIKIVRLKI